VLRSALVDDLLDAEAVASDLATDLRVNGVFSGNPPSASRTSLEDTRCALACRRRLFSSLRRLTAGVEVFLRLRELKLVEHPAAARRFGQDAQIVLAIQEPSSQRGQHRRASASFSLRLNTRRIQSRVSVRKNFFQEVSIHESFTNVVAAARAGAPASRRAGSDVKWVPRPPTARTGEVADEGRGHSALRRQAAHHAFGAHPMTAS